MLLIRQWASKKVWTNVKNINLLLFHFVYFFQYIMYIRPHDAVNRDVLSAVIINAEIRFKMYLAK